MVEGTHIHVRSLNGAGKGRLAGLSRTLRTMACRIFSDEILMSRAQAGDATALDALVARHRHRLHALGLDAPGTEAVAGDALREMVLKAFHNLDSVGATCTPGTWLYLHGFRAVFRRMIVPAGAEPAERRAAHGQERAEARDRAAAPHS